MILAVAVRSLNDSMRVGYGRVTDPVLGFLSGNLPTTRPTRNLSLHASLKAFRFPENSGHFSPAEVPHFSPLAEAHRSRTYLGRATCPILDVKSKWGICGKASVDGHLNGFAAVSVPTECWEMLSDLRVLVMKWAQSWAQREASLQYA